MKNNMCVHTFNSERNAYNLCVYLKTLYIPTRSITTDSPILLPPIKIFSLETFFFSSFQATRFMCNICTMYVNTYDIIPKK